MPHYYITVANSTLSRGDLVFPIQKITNGIVESEIDTFNVFIPASIEVGQDDMPKVMLSDLVPLLKPDDADIIPEERKDSFTITVKKDDNYVSLKAGHGLNVNDFIIVRGKNYRIMTVHHDDCFFRVEGSRNSITVDRPFESNANNQSFRYRKMIYLNGHLKPVKESLFQSHRPVTVAFKPNKNKNGLGEMEVSFC